MTMLNYDKEIKKARDIRSIETSNWIKKSNQFVANTSVQSYQKINFFKTSASKHIYIYTYIIMLE